MGDFFILKSLINKRPESNTHEMILPKEIIESSANVFRYKNARSSQVIYTTIVIAIITSISILPLINTDIYFAARGIIRPIDERSQIVSPNSGYVAFNRITYNQTVNKGDTLLVIDNRRVLEEIKELEAKIKISGDNISDLNYLLFSKNTKGSKLITPDYRSRFLKQRQQIRQLDIQIEAEERNLNRQEILFSEKVISTSEVEKFRLAHQSLVEEKSLFLKDQRFNWQTERKQEQLNLLNLKTRLQALNRSKNEFILIAQYKGTLFKTKELPIGAYVNSGEALAEVSPDTILIAEIYVPPSKIGLLRKENTIKFQVDAFNYRNWGTATGKVIEISKDIEVINNQPTFIVLASIEQKHLTLKNGTIGNLKRGLTLNARLKVTERTLFDLLYDKVDNWLTPALSNSSEPL
ncbi:HlyD family secretion protein [Roseivirga pacifica]|uniref:HlyD family secretion protein n=1 Tax=Roseivirga pacifica TaxID=1267423 RepID=UPI00227CDDD5|nr:HlyD family efflux transporter periplasmic adaptor subunit [Roseivirga pacifica]